MRIELRKRAPGLRSAPDGQATELVAVAPNAGQDAVFENLSYDWPKRISYRRTSLGLSVRIEGARGARVEEYELSRVLLGEPH